MAYGDFEDLNWRSFTDKVLRDKAFDQNMMDINRDLLQWFLTFLIKKTSGSGIKNENISNKKLTEVSKFNKGFKFLLCYWFYSKYKGYSSKR